MKDDSVKYYIKIHFKIVVFFEVSQHLHLFTFAARRGGAPTQFPISKKLKIGKTMPIFAFPISLKLKLECKIGIIFAYKCVPFNSSN